MSSEQPVGKVIAHIDLDAFYASVEERRDAARLAGKPVAVVQYNPYGDLKSLSPDDDRVFPTSNGSLIAVNYAARGAGVKRNMCGDDARKLCPDLVLVQVPTAHGKADLTLYRDEGKKVLDILSRLGTCERSSIDEAALDLTEEAARRLAAAGGVPPLPLRPDQVHVCEAAGGAAGWWARPAEQWGPGEALLACGAAVVADLRAAVEEELGYTCSAGVAHTRLLAKLCCGLHKPRQQTVAPAAAVPALLAPLPLAKLRGLGGQFGEQASRDLGVETVGQLAALPLARLEAAFGDKDGRWLYQLARGVDNAEVEARTLPKSISCGKTFRGGSALTDAESVHAWLGELAGEVAERVAADKAANARTPQLLTVSFTRGPAWGGASLARSCPLRRPQAAAMAEDAAALVRRWVAEQGGGWQVTSLSLSASNFAPLSGTADITKFLKPKAAPAGAGAGSRAAGGGSGGGVVGAMGPLKAAGGGGGAVGAMGPLKAAGGGGGAVGAMGPLKAAGGGGGAVGAMGPLKAAARGAGDALGAFGAMDALLRASGRRARDAGDEGAGPSRGVSVFGMDSAAVDESVLAELPAEIQKEVREQMEIGATAARAQDATCRRQQAPDAAGGAGSKRRGGGAAAAGTLTLMDFIKGKRPKR